MREIKFRGKTGTVKGEMWIYGYLYKVKSLLDDNYRYYIRNDHLQDCLVDEKTIGQFTGLYDKNNVPIYEGDIVESPYTNDNDLYIITYWKFGFMLQSQKNGDYYDFIGNLLGRLEVIGNIYDKEE